MNTKYIDLIRSAIWDLECKNVKSKDLLVAYSPLVDFIIKEEAMQLMAFGTLVGRLEIFMGVQIYNLHPYNEIVVYHKEHACLNTELLIKIPVENLASHFIKQTPQKHPNENLPDRL